MVEKNTQHFVFLVHHKESPITSKFRYLKLISKFNLMEQDLISYLCMGVYVWGGGGLLLRSDHLLAGQPLFLFGSLQCIQPFKGMELYMQLYGYLEKS